MLRLYNQWIIKTNSNVPQSESILEGKVNAEQVVIYVSKNWNICKVNVKIQEIICRPRA